METLTLYGNQIEDVCALSLVKGNVKDETNRSKMKSCFRKLSRLLLSSNKIKKVGANFSNLKSLEIVDLSDNLLTGEEWISSVGKEAKTSHTGWFSNLKELNLAANPIEDDAIIHVIADKAKKNYRDAFL